MGLLRLFTLGTPEIFHDETRLIFSLRKAQALLLYLAIEGGMHSRSKLAALLWPDSEAHDARTALRNAIMLLRSLLVDTASSTTHAHVQITRDLLSLDPQAPLELDLAIVQQVYRQIQMLPTPPSEERRAGLIAQLQHALSLVRGPFLDGFWLREATAFDEWHEQQQHYWQMRLQLLFDKLSSWQEAAGELEQVQTTLLHWLALDPLSEEAHKRLIQVHVAQGDTSTALQVYATFRARLMEELQIEPSPDTVALIKHIRSIETHHTGNSSAPSSTLRSRVGELIAPLVGRTAPFSQLINCYQQVRQGTTQAVLIIGETGIGKTRLASEFMSWVRGQGGEVLSGHAFEAGGQLPFQPLVEAMRSRLEEENAPEDLLDDLWLAELSRLLPELRVRYPDLPTPTRDKLTAKIQLFEAVARLVAALAKRAPLVLLLDDLHWMDGDSLALLRYLGHYWKVHGTRVLLLGTVRSDRLELNSELADLQRDLPITGVTLQTLSQAETIQLVKAILREEAPDTKDGGESRPYSAVRHASTRAVQKPSSETSVVTLGNFLFEKTGGQPFFLLETLKMFRDREWLEPQPGPNGIWRLVPTEEMISAITQKPPPHELLPPSVRTMILARLSKLSQPARQLVRACAVLGEKASARLLWKLAELEEQVGVEALEEAVGSGILYEDAGRSHPGSYYFAHGLVRDVIYSDLGEARRLVLHQHALAELESSGARASELVYHALAAGEVETAYRYSIRAGDDAMAVTALEEAIRYYEQARTLFQEHMQPTGLLLAQYQANVPEIEYLYISLERAYAYQNAWEQALDTNEELIAYGQQQHLPGLVCLALNRMAILEIQQSNNKVKVQSLLEEARCMAEASQDQRVLVETERNQAHIEIIVWENIENAINHAEHAYSLAHTIHDQELEAKTLSSLGLIHIVNGNFEKAIHYLEEALKLHTTLNTEQILTPKHSLHYFAISAPLTQPLTRRTTEAMCWGLLALAQVHNGQAQKSILSGRRALALSKEHKNIWAQIHSTAYLTYGLLDVGAYEEALNSTQQVAALAGTLPSTIGLQSALTALGSAYQAAQQWEEAQIALKKAEAMAEALDLKITRLPSLSRLCMQYVVTGQWEEACSYAVKLMAIRKRSNPALIPLDFFRSYETEALLRAGEEHQARKEIWQLEKYVGFSQRFRIPYLRSLAVLAIWDGHSEKAIDHLHEAAQIAATIGLPGEMWQIQAELGKVYDTLDLSMQADTAFEEAARILLSLAKGFQDNTLRTHFLEAPPIQQVLRHSHYLAPLVPRDRPK